MSSQKLFVDLLRPRISHLKKVQYPFDSVPLSIFAEALKSSKMLLHLKLTNVDHPELLKDTLIQVTSLKFLSIESTERFSRYNDSNGLRGFAIASLIVSFLEVNRSVKSLSLVRASIRNEGAVAIAEALQVNLALISLELSGNNFEDVGAIAIINAIRSKTTLITLKLHENNIGDRGAIAIAEELKVNTSLTELWLSSNMIGNAGAIAIAGALTVNKTLTKLNLSNNVIRPKGGVAIGNSLKVNSSLKSLYLDDNCIRNKGALAIARALVLPCTSLQELSLNDDTIEGYGAAVLLKALEYNCTLKEIHILTDKLGGIECIRTNTECDNPVVYPMNRYGISVGSSFCPTLEKISIGYSWYTICDGRVNTKALLQKLLEKLICADGAHILSQDYWMKSVYIPWHNIHFF